MTKQLILEIVVALWSLGVLSFVARKAIDWLQSKTKNQNIQMFLSWAEQAVNYAEVHFETGAEKKREAMLFIRRRLRANDLISNFSEEQIDSAIEAAVAQLKKGE